MVGIGRSSPVGVWAAGLRIGFAAIRREPGLALKRLVLPVSYWRTAEFGYVYRRLCEVSGSRLLDVGSPKKLAMMLARYRRFEVIATEFCGRRLR